MTDTSLPTAGLDGFTGAVLRPDDASYDEARTVYNSMIDRRPALIAQCASADDVAVAVRYGVSQGLEIAIRGGGHGVAGTSATEGGIVIDLRRMNHVDIDPDARTARVEGGATWSHFDRTCQPYNLATTGGRFSSTGVAGLTLGGGSGWIERKYGLASDNLLSVELVTADGRTVVANEEENPDLFWALHGGGGNFGVATALTFRLHSLPVTTFCLLLWPASYGDEVVRVYRDLVESGLPEELGGAAVYLTAPPAPFVPEHIQGTRCVGIAGVYDGPEQPMRDLFRPLLNLMPAVTMIAEMPYSEIQSAIDAPPTFRNYFSAEHLASFPDAAVELFCTRAADMVSPSPSQHLAIPWGGAVRRNAGDWPQPHRAADWVVHPLGMWEDPADDERGIAWARGYMADMKPFSTGAVYLNFIGDEGQDRVVAGFGQANYDRLARIKGEYDPHNVFHLNQNIKPA